MSSPSKVPWSWMDAVRLPLYVASGEALGAIFVVSLAVCLVKKGPADLQRPRP